MKALPNYKEYMNEINIVYDLDVYIGVVLLSTIAGFVKFLNICVQDRRFDWLVLVRDLMTGIFAGLMAFWICDYFDLAKPLVNVSVCIAGFLGIRAIEEIKGIILNIVQAYTRK